jgi:uncharacterized cupin superfamily protein
VTEPLPVINVHDGVEPKIDGSEPAGYRSRGARIGQELGAERLGVTVYELDPGESGCPYHYEYGREEWLIVLEGNPTLRTPRGEEPLKPGDTVLFAEGPDGAHKLTNDTEAAVSYLMFSNVDDPSVAFYPDSGKVGVWPPGKLFVEADAVGYWLGETP